MPLVAGERALLRVFPTAKQATSTGIPPVRARFYRDGREVHVATVSGKSSRLPTEVDESDLANSTNAEMPAHVVQPGLEMVIEIDPGGTLDSSLLVTKRIPETGRLEVDVREMPVFNLTLIPLIWTETQDSSIVHTTVAMAADPQGHGLLHYARTLLPIGEIKVTAHEAVLSSSNDARALLSETRAIQAMEGRDGPLHGPHVVASDLCRGVGLSWLSNKLLHTRRLRNRPRTRSQPESAPRAGLWSTKR